MFTSFENISDTARIWVYQADREITGEEAAQIDEAMKIFLQKWTAHGQDLSASAKVIHGYFLIVALDEQVSQASGCSIDASVHFIMELQKELGLDFFDRTRVVLEQDGGFVQKDFREVAEAIKANRLNREVNTFNNLVTTKGDLSISWKIPLGESWLKKYFSSKNTFA